ncbi:hypothetical protein BVC71_03720 [Marivivens niveibacter]|uniref:Protein-glutamate methylesterase/protein-glutamine glutaminase n=1 Tax=Marivivens niveibacter TaxID=1930667 RepID=A0A251X1K7_9RHOB|nr:chemotaxis-specific protein-glutamate methyltransferase CheB [Marivivens niveibacter]OUD10610.1 hypothetical protein BVC71_03720 [Marivivens niveibacter]
MKLLMVEDSALMRRVLRENVSADRRIDLAFARNGEDAIDKLQSFEPDVITMDINMPKMDGLTCLAHVMDIRPCPVIMLSSLTEKGATATFEALELGAVDFVAKPDGTVSTDISSIIDDLMQKVWSAFRTRKPASIKKMKPPAAPVRNPMMDRARPRVELILIGSSTGGPGVVQHLLENLPSHLPVPILIAQHMPPRFTTTFAGRLGQICRHPVIEVTQTTPLEPGTVYLAAGGKDVVVDRKFNRLVASPVRSDPQFPWHPSVSRMCLTALDKIEPAKLIGVMLTGMGDDGSAEMARIHQRGGVTIAESADTAAVFGMPGKLIEKDGASVVLPFPDIPEQLSRWLGQSAPIRRRQCS